MRVELYTRTTCNACNQTKKILVEQNVPFVEYQLERDLKREDLLQKFPDAKMLPVVVVDGVQIADIREAILKEQRGHGKITA